MDRQPLTDRLGDRLLAEYGGAAAAYSLRALNGNGDNVVRVRRASDNDEKDFTAEQIELGEMVNWVNSQTVPPLDIGIETENGRIPVPEGGTSIGTPAAAYSLRNLSTTYTGNVVDVRRNSDGNIQGFTAEEVSDGTLEAWVGAGNDGTVSKWYDQSGNDNHAVQTTPANQPTIVEGGSLVTGGIDFDGVDDYFDLDLGADLAQPNSFFMVHESDSLNYDKNEFFDAIGASPRTLIDSTEGVYRLAAPTGFSSTLTLDLAQKAVVGVFVNSTSSFLSKNGEISATSDAGTDGVDQFSYIGRSFTRYYDGKMDEFIIYPSDQSDNRTAIEANIGEYYGITGIPTYDNTVDGFVETWYDQSGNGNDATQSVTGSQPKIVDGGSLVAGGLNFDGTDDFFNITSAGNIFQNAGYGCSYSVSKNNSATGSTEVILYAENGNAGGTRFRHGNEGTDQFGMGARRLDGDSFSAAVTARTANKVLLTAEADWSNGVGTFYVNGSSADTLAFSSNGSTSNTTSDSVSIGRFATTGGAAFNGQISELIIYNADNSSSRVAIESNINNYYNIYP